MSDQHNHIKIKRYVAQLKKSLKHLPQVDRDDICKEIVEHIVDKWGLDSNQTYDENYLDDTFKRLGSPVDLAKKYCEQRNWPKPAPTHTVRNILLISLASILLLTALAGYGIMHYIVNPVIGAISGRIDINDSGIYLESSDGTSTLSISEDGIYLKEGDEEISVSDEGVSVKDGTDNVLLHSDGNVKIDDQGINVNINSDSTSLLESTTINSILSQINKKSFLAEKNMQQTYSTSNLSTLIVDGKLGRINIKGENRDDILVDHAIHVYALNGRNDTKHAMLLLDQHNLDAAIESSKLHITSDGKQDDGYLIWNYIQIKIPQQMHVEVDMKYNLTTITNLHGNIAVESKIGNIELRDIDGSVTIDSSYGDMIISNIKQNVTADIRFGNMSVSNVFGDFVSENKYGNIVARQLHENITMTAKFGNIDLDMLGSKGFTLGMMSKMGKATASFPLSQHDNMSTATIDNGKQQVKLSCKFGNVHIHK